MDSLIGKSNPRSRRTSSSSSGPSSPKRLKPALPHSEPSPTKPPFYGHSTRLKNIPTETEAESELVLSEIPCDTEAALIFIKNLTPSHYFPSLSLPPIVLMSQLRQIVRNNQDQLDRQLEALAKANKVLVFSTTTTSASNFQIVFYSDFLEKHSSGAEVFQKFVTLVLPDTDGCGFAGSLRFFSKKNLMSRWKFTEDEVRQLVNGGFLGIRGGGNYCLSLPWVSRFVKVFNGGNKVILNIVKKASYKEILQRELEVRPSLKKTVPLGVSYHIHDLIGTGMLTTTETTSGPLLRIRRK